MQICEFEEFSKHSKAQRRENGGFGATRGTRRRESHWILYCDVVESSEVAEAENPFSSFFAAPTKAAHETQTKVQWKLLNFVPSKGDSTARKYVSRL
jgi:hypothetical protein